MSGSRTHWKKPATRVYDYNYNLGEHYYKPQLRHAELKSHGRATSPPKAKTFAERFAENPVYGLYGSTTGRKSSLTDDLFGKPNRSNADRFAPHGERFGTTQSEDAEFGRPRYNPNDEFGRARFSLGDRLLDAAGTGVRGLSPRIGGRSAHEPPSPRIIEDSFHDPFFTRGKGFGREGNLAGDSDFMNEDPFKPKTRRGFDTKSADDMMDEIRRDTESAASKFRSKLRVKKTQDDPMEFGGSDDAESTTESRIEKIRARARARIAEAMEDDFSGAGNHFSGEDSYGFKSPKGVGFSDDFDNIGGRSGSSKTVKMSKRSMKTSYDAE